MPFDDVLVRAAPDVWVSPIDIYLRRAPDVVAALREGRVRVVAFRPPGEPWRDSSRFFASAQHGLDEAERAIGAAVARPLFVALTSLNNVADTNAFELQRDPSAPQPCVELRARRGLFAGYVGLGEGGAAFFRADGTMDWGGPAPELVMQWIRRLVEA